MAETRKMVSATLEGRIAGLSLNSGTAFRPCGNAYEEWYIKKKWITTCVGFPDEQARFLVSRLDLRV